MAFTLVEMLVAVTLVLLMMLMFGQIFELATGSLSQQQGLADNDQRARMLQTLIRSDVRSRTFRILNPYYAGETSEVGSEFRQGSHTDRMGYFYISENDAGNDRDDILQFTVWSAHPSSQGEDKSPYYGKASLLTGDENDVGIDVNQDGTLTAAEKVLDEFSINGNQPERDDANIFPDGTSSSPYAEVSYFLRSGNLYRRVLLIRQPLDIGNGATDDQPRKHYQWDPMNSQFVALPNAPEFMDPDSDIYSLSGNAYYPDVGLDGVPFTGDEVNTGDFWHDFDSSAYRNNSYAKFHSVSDLNNSQTRTPDTRLARPERRFGHDHVNGQPREFLYHPGPDNEPETADDIPNAAFFGRFTRAETAHPFFNYPQFESYDERVSGPPFFPGNPPDLAAAINDGNPMKFTGIAQRPLYLVGGVAVASWGADGAPGVANFDDDGDGIVDNPEESGWPGTDDIGYRTNRRRSEDLILPNVEAFDVKVWDEALKQFVDIGHNHGRGYFRQAANWHLNSGVTYGPQPSSNAINNRIFDTWHNGSNDSNGDGADDQPPFRPMRYSPVTATPWGPQAGIWQPSMSYNVGDLVFPNPTISTQDEWWRNGFMYVFRCISATAQTGGTPPAWDSVNPVSDGGVTWQPIRNEPLPLRAIRITIRFRDQASGQVRQTTIVESLIDESGSD